MKSTKRKRGSAAATMPQIAAASPAPIDAPAAAPSAVIALASHCSVKDAAALKATLTAAVEAPEQVTLDAGAVERIDTATMQLLCAFVRDRSAGARATVWSGESKALREAAKLLGAAAMLALPENGAAA
jgi:ABC-type transporter Mla MlaB component